MTRRERLEARLEKRQDWAGKAKARSDAAFGTAHRIADGIPFGQPILVGHHSERHARRDADRIHNSMSKGCEEAHLAEHHEQKAEGLEHQLKTSIFSDDDDSIEALEARISERETQAARYVELNKAWRKSKGDVAAYAKLAGISEEAAQKTADMIATAYSWEKQPIPGYSLTNLRATIRKDKERIEMIKNQKARTEKAEQSGGVVIEGETYVRVTFAEKPDYEVIKALKDAEFHWGAGSWHGVRAKLPAELLQPA
ncbi:MAG: DUF3560 domain-containing protein [Dehalococcoidia bacterium]|nr:DUF3560 domain-containing protein [Dehalococcoidia bacterium]